MARLGLHLDRRARIRRAGKIRWLVAGHLRDRFYLRARRPSQHGKKCIGSRSCDVRDLRGRILVGAEIAVPSARLGLTMIAHSLLNLMHGVGVALQPHNLMWSFCGVLIGILIGVLSGMGALSPISMLLPL